MKPIEILQNFATNKKVQYITNNSWNDKDSAVKKTFFSNGKDPIFNKIGPYSENEVKTLDYMNRPEFKKLVVDFIPKELYNKTFKLGDFEITVQHNFVDTSTPSDYDFGSYGTKTYYFRTEETWIVILNYHGVYQRLGTYRQMSTITSDLCKPTQTNWFHIKPSVKKPYILKELQVNFDYNSIADLKDFFNGLKISELITTPMKIGKQDYYQFNNPKGSLTLREYTHKNIDFKWFVENETKNGIYTPEKSTIDRFLFMWMDYGIPIPKQIDKNQLKDLGIHTVQLRSDSHYDIANYFNLKGIKIKAPQKVIEKYRYEKYCINDEMVAKIKKEKAIEKAKEEEYIYNNQFTLMQHGKVIKENVQKEDIINYLERYSATNENFDQKICQGVKPIFDEFPNIKKLYIAYWGTFYKYESAGHRCELSYECDGMNNHISEEDLEQINELFEEARYVDIDENALEVKYGWEERGGTIIGVERDSKNKLKIFTEDYDFE